MKRPENRELEGELSVSLAIIRVPTISSAHIIAMLTPTTLTMLEGKQARDTASTDSASTVSTSSSTQKTGRRPRNERKLEVGVFFNTPISTTDARTRSAYDHQRVAEARAEDRMRKAAAKQVKADAAAAAKAKMDAAYREAVAINLRMDHAARRGNPFKGLALASS